MDLHPPPDHSSTADVDDEHRAAFGTTGDGPAGEVAFAWQYEWGGAGYGPSSPEPVHTITVTVTFPASAATGVDAGRIAADVLEHFWECDQEHVTITTHTTTRPANAARGQGGQGEGERGSR